MTCIIRATGEEDMICYLDSDSDRSHFNILAIALAVDDHEEAAA